MINRPLLRGPNAAYSGPRYRETDNDTGNGYDEA